MTTTLLLAALALSSVEGLADDWPQFRGPTGLGITPEKNLPLKWSATEGVKWKAALPGEGHASPIVVGDRVVVCGVRWPDGKADKAVIPEHHVSCFAAADGKPLWDVVIEAGPWRREDFRSGPGGGYAAPTPCSDGKRIFAVFGSAVMVALELDGKLAWRQVLKPHTFDVTVGSSPVLHGETVIFLFAMANKADSRVAAFAKADGALVWESKMPKTGFGHSTPLLIDVKGRRQLVTLASGAGAMGEAVMAFDPANGKRIWWCTGAGDAASPAYGGGLLYVDSGRGGQGTAIDPSGEGDVSATHVKWTAGGMPESIGSPLIVGEHVYRLLGSGEVKVWQVSDGQQTDRAKLGKLGSTWASPVADGAGRIYFASGGRSVVVKAGPKVEILAENDLGDPNHASPAVSGNRLFLLGLKHLYCIAP